MNEQVTTAEAILFAAGDPVETSRLAQVLEIPESDVSALMDALQERYTGTGSALRVMHLGNAWQIGTRPEFADIIRKAMEQERMRPLSNAAMEALTIVAYNQPVSKGFVERVRGIDSSSVINSLVDKGLLEEAGRIDVPGHPIGYQTTPLFLRAFGLSSLEELPEPKRRQQETFTGELDGFTAEQPAPAEADEEA
ncbi:MAG: SMC-Scp complex subunit ScpB [Oscillospiraceae bacterium]|nr:SMC-Scp complex subunit ScpB [Oscillospiraceae bacterium]